MHFLFLCVWEVMEEKFNVSEGVRQVLAHGFGMPSLGSTLGMFWALAGGKKVL